MDNEMIDLLISVYCLWLEEQGFDPESSTDELLRRTDLTVKQVSWLCAFDELQNATVEMYS